MNNYDDVNEWIRMRCFQSNWFMNSLIYMKWVFILFLQPKYVDMLISVCFSSILLPIWSIRLLYSYNVQQRKPWCSWSSAVWMRKTHSFRFNQINDGWICCCRWLFHFCFEALFAFLLIITSRIECVFKIGGRRCLCHIHVNSIDQHVWMLLFAHWFHLTNMR